jgi:hypothetical protein
LLFHERGTRRKSFHSLAAIMAGQHHDVEPISKTEEGPGNCKLS